ncbi:MAG: hypothetical protein QXD33_03420 [Nitrososphaerota archaeon]
MRRPEKERLALSNTWGKPQVLYASTHAQRSGAALAVPPSWVWVGGARRASGVNPWRVP